MRACLPRRGTADRAGLFQQIAHTPGGRLQTSQFTHDKLAIVVHDTLFSPDPLEPFRRDEASPTRTGRFN